MTICRVKIQCKFISNMKSTLLGEESGNQGIAFLKWTIRKKKRRRQSRSGNDGLTMGQERAMKRSGSPRMIPRRFVLRGLSSGRSPSLTFGSLSLSLSRSSYSVRSSRSVLKFLSREREFFVCSQPLWPSSFSFFFFFFFFFLFLFFFFFLFPQPVDF